MALTQVDQGLLGTYAQYTGFKNRIINGAMVIDQRNAGASVTLTASTLYIVDRFGGVEDTDGGMTCQQVSQAPEGFTKSIVFTTTSADASLGSTQYCVGVQRIEGNNVADLGWGTALAKTVTLSFWVRSSLTGTFSGSLVNSAADRSYPFTYTISAANTWEQKSVTVAGDTSGTWLTDNGIGIRVHFSLGSGSSYSGTAGAWASSLFFGATGATSVVGTNGATFYITGVQLEKGSTATSFDYRPYGTELQLAQRYFQKSYSIGIAVGSATAVGQLTTRIYNTDVYLPAVQQRLPVTMRSSPTVTWYTTAGVSGSLNIGAGTNTINTPFDINESSTGWLYVNGAVASGSQVGGQYTASAEL
jgi:hypothetical protein